MAIQRSLARTCTGLAQALVCALAVAGATLLLAYLDLFSRINGTAYDLAVSRIAPQGHRQSPLVLLDAGAEPHRHEAADWQRLVEVMERLGAARIVFTFIPELSAEEVDPFASSTLPVILGQAAAPRRDAPGRWSLAPLPPWAAAEGITVGLVLRAPPQGGVWRQQLLGAPTDQGWLPSIEALAAGLSGPDAQDEAPYLIDFRSGLSALPKISIERALADRLVRDLVAGKTILVGSEQAWRGGALATPLSSATGPLTASEFHAFALRTLLEESAPHNLPQRYAVLTLLLVTLLTAVLTQIAAVRLVVVVQGGFLGSIFLLWFALLSYGGLVAPLGELVLASTFASLVVFWRREAEEEGALAALLLTIAGRARHRKNAAESSASGPEWDDIARLVAEILPADGLLILQRPAGGQRLKVVARLGRPIERLLPALDLRQPLFARMVEERAPLCLGAPEEGGNRDDRRPQSENLHLVPLFKGNQLLGALALAMSALGPEETEEDLRTSMRRLAQDLIEFWPSSSPHRRPGRSRLPFARRVPPGKVTPHLLKESFGQLDRRMATLERILSGVETAVIVYDLFGHVVHANRRMSDMLNKSGIAAYSMSACEFLSAVTNCTPQAARRMLQQTLYGPGEVNVPVGEAIAGRHFILHLSPVERRHSPDRTGASNRSVQRGLICELVDVTAISDLYRLKDKLGSFLNVQLRNDISNLILGQSLLEDPRLSKAQRADVNQLMKSGLERIERRLAAVEPHLAASLTGTTVESFPIDVKSELDAALLETDKLAGDLSVEVSTESPHYVSPAIAAPRMLLPLLRAILRLLIKDCASGGTVSVVLREEEESVTCVLTNTGFGLPNDRFQHYLIDPDWAESREFQDIREGMQRLDGWKAKFEASSLVGSGFRFFLAFRKLV